MSLLIPAKSVSKLLRYGRKCSSSKYRNLIISKRFLVQSVQAISRKNILYEGRINNLFQISRTFLHSSRVLGCVPNENHIIVRDCGSLSLSDIGICVKLRGFLQYQRFGLFAVIRDFSGQIQAIFKDSNLIEKVKDISYESYVEVIGKVTLRPNDQVNKNMKTGYIEVDVERLNILNRAKVKLPFLIRNQNKPIESLAMQYRYMALRQPDLQENLKLRSWIGKKIRDYLQDVNSFIEVTTPTLSNRTPGGAQEFIVPTRIPDHFYSLVQSPQIYKQLTMIGGFEKYFQFAICYRDEGGERDRQPEFMQLDLEMANTTQEQIKSLLENIIYYSWPDYLPSLSLPFPFISFSDAMNLYGVDKPDTRFDWKITDVGHIISGNRHTAEMFSNILLQELTSARAYLIPGGQKYLKKLHISTWTDIARKEANLSFLYFLNVREDHRLKGSIAKSFSNESARDLIGKLNAQPEDVIVLAVGPIKNIVKLLGKLRLLSADVLESNHVLVRNPDAFNFLWVEKFPLFETNEDQQLTSCHHPFTAPHQEDVSLLYTDPKQVRSQHYDLVLNGCEIAGGSIRIHDSELQRHILKLLNIEDHHFQVLLEALDCGAPPHGGIALGFDRYISLLRKTKSIRDVIAFPKSALGKCLMTGAPTKITNKEKDLYNICTKPEFVKKEWE